MNIIEKNDIDTKEIVKEVLTKLNDESFKRKYGTSVRKNMERDYIIYLEERFNALFAEFKLINKNLNDVITKSELKEFLNTYKIQDVILFVFNAYLF